MNGFIDLTNIDTIKSLPGDIIDDNWMELNYLYNKALVEEDLECWAFVVSISYCRV